MSSQAQTVTAEHIKQQLKYSLTSTDFPFLGAKYSGKVRDNYITPDGKRILITTDQLSAFDRIITNIPFKGAILNGISTYWFEQTKHIINNHIIETPDPNVIIAKQCEPLKIEMVIRGYITGSTTTSIWHSYSKGERTIYGLKFPDGLKKNDKLPENIITPTTKADKGQHDERLTKEEILEQELVTPAEYEFLEKKTHELFEFGSKKCLENGLILMDTKYEFGKTPDGEIVLIDEIHTPDSSRFAIANTFEEKTSQGLEPDNLNKEFLRLWLANQGYTGEGPLPYIPDEIRIETAQKYIQAYELITGTTFKAQVRDQLTRIENILKK